ncbi:hypothetical protein HYDPIDRAFT_104505 [Hydnomerulius pinastri MD-312]|nr:hypothetical protein HYDPIDRAFT_104505 [Hydnomerulius pinastri MD-312]
MSTRLWYTPQTTSYPAETMRDTPQFPRPWENYTSQDYSDRVPVMIPAVAAPSERISVTMPTAIHYLPSITLPRYETGDRALSASPRVVCTNYDPATGDSLGGIIAHAPQPAYHRISEALMNMLYQLPQPHHHIEDLHRIFALCVERVRHDANACAGGVGDTSRGFSPPPSTAWGTTPQVGEASAPSSRLEAPFMWDPYWNANAPDPGYSCTPTEGGQVPSGVTNGDIAEQSYWRGGVNAFQAVEPRQLLPSCSMSHPSYIAYRPDQWPFTGVSPDVSPGQHTGNFGMNPSLMSLPLVTPPSATIRDRRRRQYRNSRHPDKQKKCSWRGCGQIMGPDSIKRHIREVHEGVKRKPPRGRGNQFTAQNVEKLTSSLA